MNEDVGRIFVSYSHEDAEWADHLFKEAIRTTRGVAVHSIDHNVLNPGDVFDEKLHDEIDRASGFVFLVSSTFLMSDYVRQKEWKWIEESKAADRVCCIEIDEALSKKHSDSDLSGYLKTIHRDLEARLPKAIPESSDDLKARIKAVRRSVARTLDPKGAALVDRLEERGLKDITFLAPGKMADVYVASTPTFGRKLAIKVPHPDLADRFLKTLKSAEALSRIPNVVGIYETNTKNDPFYCITELIEGQTLAKLIEETHQNKNRVPIDLTRRVLLKISLALQSAYAQNISHLNIRPSNILIDSHGEPYLLPTGRAREAHSRRWDRETLAKTHPSEFNNVPPELFGDKGWDEEAADIYALGLIGYWMIAGQLPDLIENREQLETDNEIDPVFSGPPDLIKERSDCPITLARTVRRMVHPDPSHRYRSFDELFQSLMRYSDEKLATAELSWRRCLRSGDDIFTLFYERFFTDARSAEALFENPWPTARQKNLLRDAVIGLFQFYALKQTYREIPVSLNPLEGLAQQHVGRNIENSHYLAFVRALIETVISIDPDTDSSPGDDDPVREAWKAVVEPGALFMETRVAELRRTSC